MLRLLLSKNKDEFRQDSDKKNDIKIMNRNVGFE